MKSEILDAINEPLTASTRDAPPTVSSPSEAYANMTLDGENDGDGSRSVEQRPPPRASSPAKRLHSDMDDGSMDVDSAAPARRGSGQSSPLAAKPPLAASARSLRSTSVEMADVASNGASAASSDSTLASNADSTATSVSNTPAADTPSLDDQVNKVLALSRQPLRDRQLGYVVSQKWLQRVWARTPQYADKQHEFNKSALEGEIGAVDNSDLVDTAALSEDLADQKGGDFVPLRPGLLYEHDYEILPAEAWELVVSWYGVKEDTPVIRRYVHNTSSNEFAENLQYEIYPPIFTIRKVTKSPPTAHHPAKKLVASRADSFAVFMRAAKLAAGIAQNNVRIWRLLNPSTTASDPAPTQQATGILTPEASPPPPATLCLIIDSASLTSLDIGTQREEVTGKDELANEMFNKDLNLAGAGLAEDQILILEEQDENGEYVTGTLSRPAKKASVGNKPGIPKSTPNSGRSTPTLSGAMTRGRTRNGKTRGTTGLTNLGNTCYMNSALQCIRSVEELTIYFLASEFKRDINADNPLGHGGTIAKAYAGLITSIYDEAGQSSFAPKNFKNTLGRAAPIFSGYGQQDSQEFLSFLVDGLHEDLNRIKKKPYTEYPESDDNTVNDYEAIKALGNKFRDIHHSRNDSVAMDLFNGFYKNTMICPDCNRVSITFDPYSLVTLQLPIEQTWQHTIKFIPLHGKMWEVDIDIDKHATIKQLKEYIGKRFGVEWNRIMLSEVYSHKFYRHMNDQDTIAESSIQARDEFYAFELEAVPSNWPGPKRKKYQTSIATGDDVDTSKSYHAHHDKILVPLFHRKPISTTYRSQGWTIDLWPSYILVNRAEAKDYDAILKKVLAKVAQMTTRDILTEADTSLAQSSSGSDVVLTTEEDASANGDPRVQDGSVEGEDIVEVTMTEPTETPAEPPKADDDLPDVLRLSNLLPPQFRNLFEMKYIRSGKEFLPTGWNNLDSNKSYDRISKRVRVPSTRASSVQSAEAGSDATSSDADDDENIQFSADAQSSIELANQSSDEDTQPSIEEPPAFSRGGRQKNKKPKKMTKHERKLLRNKNFNRGKKDKNPYHMEQPSQSNDESEDEDDDRLIKMGESIVLDWDSDAWDALFGATSYEDSRGRNAMIDVETWEDKELQAKKAKRAARKKNGLTLEECFAETSKTEVLSEDNAWYCSRCKELRRATKTLEIWTAPDILVVHLKRFSSHRVFRDKVDVLIDFPIEGLDLSERVGLHEGRALVYDLFAVDNHYGGLGGGHYTAYAKNFFDGQWYEYNDSSVSKKSNPKQVISTAAYLLFYRRRSSGPLGPPELQSIVNNWRNPDSEEAGVFEEEDAISRNVSPSGNGLRLGGSSRNGSSGAFRAGSGAVVGALRGGGSDGAGSLLRNGVAAGTLDDESPPGYEDEGYADDDDVAGAYPTTVEDVYAPLHSRLGGSPNWSFNNVNRDRNGGDSDVVAFDEEERDRMAEDFGEELSFAPGHSSPVGEMELIAPVDVDDAELAEIRLKGD